ncbi:hypothetical protein LC668_00190 [Fusobacterium vincentii]|uniref:PBECR4 domain-containing protein n=1 Tax=Fusobacterium TaxID=848 RepID=UPI001EEE0FC2|nr:PBECR4 domain-containing protein [Fusobacterium nucleatum]MCG6835690.1 hypothetical protein [Fusobacterium nucleatum]
MDDKEIWKKIRKSYFVYKEQFLNKDFYIVSRKNKNIEILETMFRKEHFMHLVGISGMSANSFFEKVEKNTLSLNEFKKLKKSNFIFEKLNSFPKLKELLISEPYLYNFHPHSTTKVELDKIIADKNKEINKSLIGLKMMKNSSQNFYIPASIEKRKASEVTTEERKRIICILEKASSEKDYSKVFFRNLEENLSLYIPEKVYLAIKDQLEKVNYNCLTGCIIGNIESKHIENRWIIKEDVERLNIEKKDNAKEVIVKIGALEDKKLYGASVSYYNISDLQITKEIEQKFVPIKQKTKEKTVEKAKDKGIEIGD